MFPCELKDQPARHTLTIRFQSSIEGLPDHFEQVFATITAYLQEFAEQPAGSPFAIYHDMSAQPLDVEAGFPVAEEIPGKREILAGEIPGGRYAICHYTGPADQIGTAYQTLTQFAQENGLQPGGIAYEWYLSDSKIDLAFPV